MLCLLTGRTKDEVGHKAQRDVLIQEDDPNFMYVCFTAFTHKPARMLLTFI